MKLSSKPRPPAVVTALVASAMVSLGTEDGTNGFMSGVHTTVLFAMKQPKEFGKFCELIHNYWMDAIVPHGREIGLLSDEPFEITERTMAEDLAKLARLVRDE